jgi:hypothetical protein
MTKDELIQELYDCLGEMDYWAMSLSNRLALDGDEDGPILELEMDRKKTESIRKIAREEFDIK